MIKKVWGISLYFLLFGLPACQNESEKVTVQQDTPAVPAEKAVPVKIKDTITTAQLIEAEEEQEAAATKAKEEEEAAAANREQLAEEKRKEARRKVRAEKRAAEKLKKKEKAEKEKTTATSGKLQFPIRSHDFGRIQEGDKIEQEFKFYNQGQAPIVISNVKASCGCTKTTFPKEPVMPGESGTIGVTFDSKGKLGRQKPFISVITNGTPSVYSLYLEGEVDTDR